MSLDKIPRSLEFVSNPFSEKFKMDSTNSFQKVCLHAPFILLLNSWLVSVNISEYFQKV